MRHDYQAFPNTHWSMVRRAGGDDGESRSEALRILLERYMPALISHLRFVKGLRAEEAEELVQAFAADKLLEKTFLQHADQKRGKFRTFLLTCLNHFHASRCRAEKVRFAEPFDETSMDASPTGPHGGDATVEAEWARSLLRSVLAGMERACRRNGQENVWIVFEARLLREIFGPAGENSAPVAYEELARTLNLQSPTQAANLLVTAKRMYQRLLRSAISEYEKDPAAQEAEIAELSAILARCPLQSEKGD